MRVKEKDILIVARPDHSMQIYRALSNQNQIKFHYITFKVVRNFIKNIIPYKKMQTVSSNCTIAIIPTIIQICKKTFYFKFAQNWKTEDFLSPYVKTHLNHNSYRVIHYWPEYASSVMNDYIRNNISPETKVLADMYMPNPEVILADMEPVYRKYGLPAAKESWLADYAEQTKIHFKYVTDIVVASSYVQRTMEHSFPDKRYHIIPYGIPVSETYTIKTYSKHKSYLYVGRISVEKGCDILLEWFKLHPEKEIHLYGALQNIQKDIFEPYWAYNNIFYHGSVSKDVLKKETPLYDVGILLSRFDAYAMSIGEIIGCGLPVIVSDHTGIMDDVNTYGFGVVTKLDEHSVTSAIEQMDDKDFYEHCCQNIYNYVNTRQSTFGERMIEFYKNLIKHYH